MPLTKKGSEIMAAMKKQYGEKKGESVFYASKNAGKITGVDEESMPEWEEGQTVDLSPNLSVTVRYAKS
jgi:hypothetical protein